MENDPTIECPPGQINAERAQSIYYEAFLRCFEFIVFNRIIGNIYEFGTYKGFTARILASLIRGFQYPGNLFLFDSFEGLPEIESEVDKRSYEVSIYQVWGKGSMRLEPGIENRIKEALTEILPPERVTITKGYFENTLEQFLPNEKAAILHIDCDLYASTITVLEKALDKNVLQDGTLLLFDDFNCGCANPTLGERKALDDFLARQKTFTCSHFFNYGWNASAFILHAASESVR